MDGLIPSVIDLGKVGYQTDMSQQARSLTHYTRADNVIFEIDAQVRKFGGAAKVNASAITSAPNVNGMHDFWFGTPSTGFTQQFVVVTADSKVYKEDMDGVYDDITGGMTITANAIPVFAVAKNRLLIAFNTRDAALSYTGTGSCATFGAPSCSGVVFHCNRVWVWDGSILYYSGYDSATDWTSADSGKFTLDDGDGDIIIGCAIYKNSLIVFKGPNYGKIIVITGRSPASFARDTFTVTGMPLQTHNSIIYVGDDVAFMTPRGCHLMSAVQQFGNYAEADITRYLKNHFKSKINRSRLNEVWGVNYIEKSSMLWATPKNGAGENNQIFGMSYIRLQEDGWKPFTVTRGCNSLAIRKNPTSKIDEVVTGNTDGFVRRQDVAARSIDSTIGYTMKLESPNIAIGTQDASGKPQADQPISIESIYLRGETRESYPIQARITRDNTSADTYAFALGTLRGGTFVLGSSLLGGTDTLGGGTGVEIAYADPPARGTCRTFKFQIIQAGADKDANLIELGFKHKPLSQARTSGIL